MVIRPPAETAAVCIPADDQLDVWASIVRLALHQRDDGACTVLVRLEILLADVADAGADSEAAGLRDVLVTAAEKLSSFRCESGVAVGDGLLLMFEVGGATPMRGAPG